MLVDEGMDTGDILTQKATPIQAADTGQTLHDRLASLGADLLMQTIPRHVQGELAPQKQDEARASYAPKINKDDGRIEWMLPARRIHDRIRAFTPWPGASTLVPPRQQRLKISKTEIDVRSTGKPGRVLIAEGPNLVVGCGQQALRILELQLEGRRRMTAAEFLAGHNLPAGADLG
jgi:methionyl-tRNA formyltransferase